MQGQAILTNWEAIYERTTGCVGVLSDWMGKTVHEVLLRVEETNTSVTFTLAALLTYAPTKSQVQRMATEALAGNKALEKSAAKMADVRTLLGMPDETPYVVEESRNHLQPPRRQGAARRASKNANPAKERDSV